ncbi:MAG: hypothetical protein IPH72_30305 [Sandaracinaceae bacterium]|nr:hypothetical protein [Sandaracinaceae bacterium]
MLLFPCLIVGLALMAIVVPGLTTAVLLRGCARVLKQSIWSNSTEQLHTPLSGVRRGQARSAIRGVLAPGGYALTALMLTALPDTADPRIAATLALVTAGLMAWLIAVYARRTYTHALHQAVDERRWEIGSPRGRKTDTLDAETYSAFRVELLGDDPERASLAAEILAATDGQKSAEVLSAGLRHSSPDVRLTSPAGSRATQFVGEALAEHACHEPEPVVRLACVRALRACANPERSALTTLEQLSSDPDPEVAAAAQVGVLVWTLEGEELGNALLPFLSPGESPARLREALFVLDADSIEARGMQSIALLHLGARRPRRRASPRPFREFARARWACCPTWCAC